MFDYLTTTLNNSLRVVFIPTGSTSLTVRLAVGAGSKNEAKEVMGIAHFLEHMAFKGTKKRPDAKIIRQEIDRIGAAYNASTGKEVTSYYIKSAPENLDLMMDIVSDIIFNALVKPQEIEKEKGVIIEEYNMYQDQPIDRVDDLFEGLILGKDTSLGRKIIGTKETIQAVNRKKFIDFKSRFYQPANMVLAIAGGLTKKDWSKVKQLAEKYFGQAKNEKINKGKISFKEDVGKEKIEMDKTEQTHMIVGLPVFAQADDRRWPFSNIRMILAGNSISRLWTKIREDRGWVYYIYPYLDYFQETGIFGIKLGLRSDKVSEAKKIIQDEMVNLSKTVTGQELADAKSCFKGHFLLSVENPSTTASIAALSWLLEGKLRKAEDGLKKIEESSLGEVKEVAKDLFKESRFSIAAIGPIKKI